MAQKSLDEFPLEIRIVLAICESAEAHRRRENNALRNILRKQGLSDSAIQRRVNKFLKKPEEDESAPQLLKRVCEESLKHFQDSDLAEWLAKIELKGPRQ